MGGGGENIRTPWGSNPSYLKETGGVKPMEIAGRVKNDKERLSGMTDEERAWRRKWLADQVLLKEPRTVPMMEKDLMNPIRRFYRFPLDVVFAQVAKIPAVGAFNAKVFRFYTGRILLGLWGIMGIHYYFKYNANTWERRGGWRVTSNGEAVYPGEPGYPYAPPPKQPHEYHDRKFSESIFAKKFPQYGGQLETNDCK